jgi:hypothetical protein
MRRVKRNASSRVNDDLAGAVALPDPDAVFAGFGPEGRERILLFRFKGFVELRAERVEHGDSK